MLTGWKEYVLIPWLNDLSLRLFDNCWNPLYIAAAFIAISSIVAVMVFLYKEKGRISFVAGIVIIAFIALSTLYVSLRGSKINDIRKYGFSIQGSLEKFKSINSRYPHDTDELNLFIITSGTDESHTDGGTTFLYRPLYDTSGSGKPYGFNLSIHNDMLGGQYFVFRINPDRFELTSS